MILTLFVLFVVLLVVFLTLTARTMRRAPLPGSCQECGWMSGCTEDYGLKGCFDRRAGK